MSRRFPFRLRHGNTPRLLKGLSLLTLALAMMAPGVKAQNQCDLTLTLFGDEGGTLGWTDGGIGNQSFVTVNIFSIDFYDSYTIDSYSTNSFVTFNLPTVDSGNEILFSYFLGGVETPGNQQFMLTNCIGDTLYISKNPPEVGDVSVIAHCPHPPTDCHGGVTVCNTGSLHVQDSIQIGGCIAGFDPAQDGPGCITNTFAGTWYYFSPTAPGPLSFSIKPVIAGNYNFSLWGPYDQAHCPTDDPIRCSTYHILVPAIDDSTGLTPSSLDDFDPDAGDGWAKALTIDGTNVNKVYALFIQQRDNSLRDFTLTFYSPPLYCGLLPIELIAFQAQARGRVVDITWATATEQNSDRFDIQRSFDDSDYVTIGTLPAAGDAQFRTDYAFTDHTPGHGANYYRLREVDRDGAVTITRTVVALMDGAVQVPVLFPNPVTGILNVSFTAFRDGNALFSVRDALGRTVLQQESPVQRGSQTVRLPMDELQQGCYSLQIDLPSGVPVRGGSFVKQ